ncbi:MAG TPA: DUF2339 domain-containing protein [Allosphingosinicella sp.]|nr:DUF2339 domain-containing protein [Allosphingosinicella sp.]
MGLLTFLLFGALIVALFVANRDLKQRLARLERRLAALEEGERRPAVLEAGGPRRVDAQPMAERPAAPPLETPKAAPAGPLAVAQSSEPPVGDEVRVEAPPRPKETIGALFERLVGGNMLIWIGGIALAVAGILIIRFSIGLITPGVRMAAAAILGLLFVAGGEYARAGRLADDPRIAQALVGAGLAVLYATAYGTHILYGLIGPATASAAMLAITAAALGLSLRHGSPTAVMGLTGGFLTPLLVGDPDAGAVPLLAYLALLNVAIFLVAWRRGWTWLAAAAVGLSFVWSGYLLYQPADDALAAGAFIVLLAVGAAMVRPGRGRELGLIQPLAIGIVQLAVLVARTDLGIAAWALFGALALASMALALIRRDYWLAPPLAALLALLLLLAKATTGQDPLVPGAAAGIAALFGLGGLALSAWRPRLLWTAIACAGLAGPALIVRAARPELLDRPAWGGLMLALALGPAALAWLNRRRASAKAPADLALLIAGADAAMLLGASVWDLLPPDLIAAGWLVVALAVGLAARRLGDVALTTVAAATAAIAVARSVWMVPELSAASFTALVGDPVLAPDLPPTLTALYALALPALLLVGLRLALPPLPLGARRALPVVAGLFGVAALYVWFKQAFGLAGTEDFVARGLLERTLITQALFALGWLLGSGRVRSIALEPDLVRLGGTLLTAFAAARLIWFDLFVHNPAWAEQSVGTVPVANLIVPEYLLSAVWLYLARRRADHAPRSGFWLVAFLASLVAGAMLLVRQAFQGPILTGPDMPIAEFYGYSLAGLILAIALLVAGMRLPDKALRLAGLLLLTATILKVFLVDASELEGIWRILSFLGLGVALIGIGRLYGPVLRAERASE